MAQPDQNPTDNRDEAADTASFQRFVEQEQSAGGPVETGGDGGRGFRLLTLAVGALVLVVIVALLMR